MQVGMTPTMGSIVASTPFCPATQAVEIGSLARGDWISTLPTAGQDLSPASLRLQTYAYQKSASFGASLSAGRASGGSLQEHYSRCSTKASHTSSSSGSKGGLRSIRTKERSSIKASHRQPSMYASPTKSLLTPDFLNFHHLLRQRGLPKTLRNMFLMQEWAKPLHHGVGWTSHETALGFQLARSTRSLEHLAITWNTDAESFFREYVPHVWDGASPASPARQPRDSLRTLSLTCKKAAHHGGSGSQADASAVPSRRYGTPAPGRSPYSRSRCRTEGMRKARSSG